MPNQQLSPRMRLHANLPRQGPGSEDATMQALSLIPALKEDAVVLDVGCGPGRSAVILAKKLDTKILAIDLNEPFLEELKSRAQALGLSHKITTRCMDMEKLDVEPGMPGNIDLIWAEGSIYTIGFDNALTRWYPQLAESGIVACTEMSWLVDNQPDEAKQFWDADYPGMRSVKDNIASAQRIGFTCLNHFSLPPNCWWDEYYVPLENRIKELEPDAVRDSALASVLDQMRREISIYRNYGDSYDYVFYIFQKSRTA